MLTRSITALRGPVCALALALAVPSGAFAQEMSVPVEIQVTILAKVLSFDRNLQGRTRGEVVIGVVYQNGVRLSAKAKQQFMDAARQVGTVAGVPVRTVEIRIDGERTLKEIIRSADVDILYITPIRSVDMAEITAQTRELKITTLTGVPEYVESGIAVGIGIRDEKPLILINLSAAREEGADFTSQLLRIVRIVQ